LLFSRTALAATIALPLGMALTIMGTPSSGSTGPAPIALASFADDIMPILERSCVSCHGAEVDGEIVIELSLNLMTYEGLMAGSEYGTVIEPGDPGNSLFLEMVEAGDMPEDGDPLSAEEIELIRTWIAEGAENN
jgi:mono/diheme cytochrome c family protein